MTAPRALASVLLVIGMGLQTGCGYTLHGRVVEGPWSHISVANAREAEATASGSGVGGVSVSVYRDPGRASQQLIATAMSSPDGSFAIPLAGAFGAGWMEEVWLIQASRSGYTSVEEVVTLPMDSRARPLVITLTRGRSVPFAPPNDYERDLERFR